jgi:hypothetical protein
MGRNRRQSVEGQGQGQGQGQAQVHDPEELRERLEGEEAKAQGEERDYRALAEEYGISNADNYTDEGLKSLIAIRERQDVAQKAKEERVESFRESLGDHVVESEQVSSAPGAADVGDSESDGGHSDADAGESRGGEV